MFISDDKVEVIEGVFAKNTVNIKNSIILPTPKNMVVSGLIENVDDMAQFLRSSLNDNNITTRGVHLTIYSPAISFREMIFPKCKKRELNALVKNEMIQILNPELTYIVDYSILYEFNEDGNSFYRVSACALLKDIADTFYKTVKMAGLKPLSLDVCQNSLSKFMEFYITTNEPYILIDVREEYIMTLLFEKGKRMLSRSVQLKINANLEDTVNDELSLIIHQNISKIIQFYKSQNSKNSIKYVYLSGFNVNSSELLYGIETTFEVTANIINQPEFVNCPDGLDISELCLCIGAIMRD